MNYHSLSIKTVLLSFAFFLFAFNAHSDGRLISWGTKDLVGMTEARFESARSWKVSEILDKNLHVDEWPEAYLILLAANEHKDSIMSPLLAQLDVEDETILKNTSRLIIWERILSGHILFEGKGLQIDDDLFSVAGRANWILRNITGKNFGLVKPNSTAEDLKRIKRSWVNWNNGKDVEEYQNPYQTESEGLSEIKSKQALQAIIVSLNKSPEKEALISGCLKRIYNLDKLPDDPASPANFCSPDNYSYVYLSTITGIEDKHDFKWWNKWWAKNKDKLVWNKETGQFDLE